MQLILFIDLFKSALHVSGDKLAHPQKHFLTVYRAFGTMNRYCCRPVTRLRWNSVEFHLNHVTGRLTQTIDDFEYCCDIETSRYDFGRPQLNSSERVQDSLLFPTWPDVSMRLVSSDFAEFYLVLKFRRRKWVTILLWNVVENWCEIWGPHAGDYKENCIWSVSLCRLVEIYWRFGRITWRHIPKKKSILRKHFINSTWSTQSAYQLMHPLNFILKVF